MLKKICAITAAAAFLAASAPSIAAGSGPVPKVVGACVATTIKEIGSRLEGAPDSGSAIFYTNGISQVSYDMVPGIQSSHPGDRIKLCLIGLPSDCPKGDDRGKIYAATNLRTHRIWQAPDSEHSCGGA